MYGESEKGLQNGKLRGHRVERVFVNMLGNQFFLDYTQQIVSFCNIRFYQRSIV